MNELEKVISDYKADKKKSTESPFLSMQQTTLFCDCHRSSIYNLIAQNKLKPYYFGGGDKPYFLKEDLLSLFAQKKPDLAKV